MILFPYLYLCTLQNSWNKENGQIRLQQQQTLLARRRKLLYNNDNNEQCVVCNQPFTNKQEQAIKMMTIMKD
jgi:hypothetical protein